MSSLLKLAPLFTGRLDPHHATSTPLPHLNTDTSTNNINKSTTQTLPTDQWECVWLARRHRSRLVPAIVAASVRAGPEGQHDGADGMGVNEGFEVEQGCLKQLQELCGLVARQAGEGKVGGGAAGKERASVARLLEAEFPQVFASCVPNENFARQVRLLSIHLIPPTHTPAYTRSGHTHTYTDSHLRCSEVPQKHILTARVCVCHMWTYHRCCKVTLS